MSVSGIQERHFKLRTDITKINHLGATLYRIEATRDSVHAQKGELGGWIEHKNNIIGDSAWVADDAEVSTGSSIKGEALIEGNAKIMFDSKIFAKAVVSENAIVNRACVLERGKVFGNAVINRDAGVIGDGRVGGNAVVSHALIAGKSEVGGDAVINKHIIINTPKGKMITKSADISFAEVFATKNKKSEQSTIFTHEEISKLEAYYKKHKEIDDLHYELTKANRVTDSGELLYQIRATRDLDFGDVSVSKGELGGYVSSSKSLINGAWIGKNTLLSGNTQLNNILIDANYEIKDPSDIVVAQAMTRNNQTRKAKEIAKQKPIQISMEG